MYQASRWSQPRRHHFHFLLGIRTRRRISFAIWGFRKCMQWSCYCNQSWKKAIIMYDMILLSNCRHARKLSLFIVDVEEAMAIDVLHMQNASNYLSLSLLLVEQGSYLDRLWTPCYPPIQLLTTCADRARSRSLTLANHFDIWSSIMKFLQLHRFVISGRLNTYTSFVGGYVRLLLSFPFITPFHNGAYSLCYALNQAYLEIFEFYVIIYNNIV